MQQIVVSGVQVTGNLHIGNYLGAIKNWLPMQDKYKCFFFLANLHSLTSEISADYLYSSTINCIAAYLALGLDPKKSVIFPQSMVPEHTELAWIFNCTTPLGWLKRMTQFKDKATKGQDNANLGLLSYPVLMAADILLYKAQLVPVGKDQKQHLEITRDIAGVINRRFGYQVFPLPENLTLEKYAKIKSLRDGTKKMSKSDAQEASRINLIDTPEQISEKIKKAKTDNISYLSYDPNLRPEISNLLDLYEAFSNFSKEQIIANYETQSSFAKFKQDLAELIINDLSPIQAECRRLLSSKDYLDDILKEGVSKARIVATETLKEIKQGVGLI